MKKNNLFNKFAEKIADWMGQSWSFIISLLFVFGWLIAGPLCHFSDSWQLFINTLTSIITFLMVFIIQNTQNRNNKISKIMMNEIITALKKADNQLIDIDDLSDDELKQLEKEFKKKCKKN